MFIGACVPSLLAPPFFAEGMPAIEKKYFRELSTPTFFLAHLAMIPLTHVAPPFRVALFFPFFDGGG